MDPSTPTSHQCTAPRTRPLAGLLRALGVSASISLMGIAAALVLIEVGFRLFHSAAPAHWRDRPKQYFIAENAVTLQDYPHERRKPPGSFRIGVVGDSFTFAPYLQLEDAFPKRLERWLNLNSRQPKVEVINYGVPAYSTHHELAVVAQAMDEQADLVIVQITLNDPEIKPYTPQELMLEKNQFGELELPDTWIYRHWRSLVFVLKRLHNNRTRKNYTRKFFALFEKKDTWSSFRDAWVRIGKLAKKRNVRVVGVLFPVFGVAVDEQYPFWPLSGKISRLLASHGIPFLDLTETYRNIPVERLQVLPGEDFHPNEIGHRMAAEAVLEWLAGNKFIPDEIVPKAAVPQRIGIKIPGPSPPPVQ